MKCRAAFFAGAMCITLTTVAQPLPPPPRNPILENRPRQPSVWQQIQDPVDRSMGRIVDEPRYQIERFQRRQDEDYRRIVPQTEFQRFDEERERTLRIEQRRQQEQMSAERARREELDRREYELRLNAGLTATSFQAIADEKALREARGQRDEQLIEAQNQRAEALRATPGNRAQIEATYQQRANQIRSAYEVTRARILGVDPAPATQPGQ